MNDARSFQARATRAPNPRAPILPQSSPRAPNERGAAERRPSEQTDRRRLHTAAELQRTHTATYTVQSRNGNGNSPWFAGTGSPFPDPRNQEHSWKFLGPMFLDPTTYPGGRIWASGECFIAQHYSDSLCTSCGGRNQNYGHLGSVSLLNITQTHFVHRVGAEFGHLGSVHCSTLHSDSLCTSCGGRIWGWASPESGECFIAQHYSRSDSHFVHRGTELYRELLRRVWATNNLQLWGISHI